MLTDWAINGTSRRRQTSLHVISLSSPLVIVSIVCWLRSSAHHDYFRSGDERVGKMLGYPVMPVFVLVSLNFPQHFRCFIQLPQLVSISVLVNAVNPMLTMPHPHGQPLGVHGDIFLLYQTVVPLSNDHEAILRHGWRHRDGKGCAWSYPRDEG